MTFESIFIFPDTKVFPKSLGMNRYDMQADEAIAEQITAKLGV